MPLYKKFFLPLLFLPFFLSAGCSATPPSGPLAPLDQQLQQILKEEYDYKNALVTAAGKTLWIYLPGERELFEYKVKDPQEGVPRKFSVLYADGFYTKDMFVIEYDIVRSTKAGEDKGLSSSYSEEFNKEYRNAFNAVSRTYLDSEGPEFFILVNADTKTGTKVTNTFCLEDIKEYQAGAMPQEEFLQRVLTESRGGKQIINDTTGGHLDISEMTWREFLLEQMINRINFKYGQSDFPPGDDAENEILKLATITLQYYDFTDFLYIKLHDLRAGTVRMFGQADLPQAE